MHYWVLLILTLLSAVNSKIAISITEFDGDPNFYKCVKQQGFSEIMFPCQQDGINYIYAAKKEGLIVHGIYFACRKDNPDKVARQLRLSFGTNIMEKVWIVAVTIDHDPLCNWTNDQYSPQSNCEYLQSLISALRKYNQTAHILTNRDIWQQNFGEDVACPGLGDKTLLWWLPHSVEQDLKPDFDLYQQIGGWQKPYMKMYQRATFCNQSVSKNYYE